MKILVPVKRVVDPAIRLRFRDDDGGLDESGLRYCMNPFDEIALEEALRLREAGRADDVVIVSCGTDAVLECLRHGLALGAGRAIHIATETRLEPLGIARLLKELALRERPELILMGKQAIDDDAAQTGPMLAAMLGWPQGCFASGVMLEGGRVELLRELDDGQERLTLSLPALVTTDLRLNAPRFATLANTMKARRKEIERIEASSLGVDFAPRLRVRQQVLPATRAPVVMLESVDALAARLRPFAGSGQEGAE